MCVDDGLRAVVLTRSDDAQGEMFRETQQGILHAGDELGVGLAGVTANSVKRIDNRAGQLIEPGAIKKGDDRIERSLNPQHKSPGSSMGIESGSEPAQLSQPMLNAGGQLIIAVNDCAVDVEDDRLDFEVGPLRSRQRSCWKRHRVAQRLQIGG